MLPDLPIYKSKEEGDFGADLVAHVSKLKQPFFEFSVWQELKVSDKKGIFYFSQVKPHQVVRCLDIKRGGVFVRITQATVSGKSGVPDYVWVYKQPAYIVVRYPKSWCFIDIDTFILERDRSKKKSMVEDRARELSIKVIDKP
jgi:hypothetical protein